jgi:hypothetical protein
MLCVYGGLVYMFVRGGPGVACDGYVLVIVLDIGHILFVYILV